jgi:hypothetical protein
METTVTKITIEIESGDVAPSISTSGVPGQAGQRGQAPAPAPGGANPPPEVLAQAAAIGAINAGPAPSESGAAPIASSVGGTTATSSHDAASGGTAPRH